MKEAVEDEKVELKESGTKIQAKDVDVLRLIDTSDLYGLINEGINKYYHCNTAQGITNDMVGITNVPTTVHCNNKASYVEKKKLMT